MFIFLFNLLVICLYIIHVFNIYFINFFILFICTLSLLRQTVYKNWTKLNPLQAVVAG